MTKAKKQQNGIIRDHDLRRLNIRLTYWTIFIVCLFFLAICFFPLIWVFTSSFKNIREFSRSTAILPQIVEWNAFAKTWKLLNFSQYYLNSLYSVIGSTVCAVLFNGLLGFVLSKIKPAGSKIVEALVMWGLLIPTTTSIVPLFMNITKLHLSGTFIPLWFSMGANAFYVVLFKNFFDSLPKTYIEAAKIDGANDLKIFSQIAIPLSKAIVAVVALYAVTASWSDFLLPFLILQNTKLETVMVKLFSLMRGAKINDVEMLRAIVFAIIPPIILFAFFQKQITQVTIQGGIKG
jgi:multiple sugar transport system permease protein